MPLNVAGEPRRGGLEAVGGGICRGSPPARGSRYCGRGMRCWPRAILPTTLRQEVVQIVVATVELDEFCPIYYSPGTAKTLNELLRK